MASRKDQLTDKYVKYTTKFPVEKNTVYYEAFHLNQIMAGNPYGIFRYLMEHEEYSKLKHIWVFRDEKYLAYDTFSRYKECPNVTFVKAFSNEHLKALATSQYLISNSSLPDYWIKRKGQIYINTWHGTPLKYIGQDDADYNEHAVGNTQRNFLHCDYMALQNRYTIDILLKAYDLNGIMR